jgi:hypothetical protein
MDEGLPIAYEVLDRGVEVYSSDRAMVGHVDHVLAAPEVDIFHGIIVRCDSGRRFVAAEQISSLHERGVDLLIDAVAVAELPPPEESAPAYHVREPGVATSRWRHLLDMLEGRSRTSRDWREEN